MKKLTLGPLTFAYFYPAEEIKDWCNTRKRTTCTIGPGTLVVTFENRNEELLFYIQFPQAKAYGKEDVVVEAGQEIAWRIDNDLLNLMRQSE